jgi:hypothetical protein
MEERVSGFGVRVSGQEEETGREVDLMDFGFWVSIWGIWYDAGMG